jgi:ParB family chromosome partitioning protein
MSMNKKIGLGRGLGALLPASDEISTTSGLTEAPVRAILPNPHQPRSQFDEQTLRELADSIREHGLIQPLIVTRTGEDHYTLIAGERLARCATGRAGNRAGDGQRCRAATDAGNRWSRTCSVLILTRWKKRWLTST